jgi:hypothetical protein
MRSSLARAAVELLESRRLLASTITGFAFYDRNASGVHESGTDFPLQSATAYLDLNNNSALDTGEPSGVSGSGGGFSITSNQSGGFVRVRVAYASGYTSSAPSSGFSDVFAIDGTNVAAGSFGAWTTGAISGSSYVDADANGVITADDHPMLGATVYADLNLNGTRDADEPFSTTSTTNQITWRLDLKPGTYTFRVELPSGYIQSVPGGDGSFTRTLTAGLISLGNAVGGYSTGRVGGSLFNDTSGNGIRDGAEPLLTGRTVYVDLDKDGNLDAGEPTSGTPNGTYSFDLYPGTYQIRQVLPEGWDQTAPADNQPHEVTVRSGFGWILAFGSRELGRIAGVVFNDNNANRAFDTDEFPLSPGVFVYLDANDNGQRDAGEPQAQTNTSNGSYVIHAPQGTYTLRVERPAGWVNTNPLQEAISIPVPGYNGVLNVGPISLHRAVTISGVVFNDDDGDGLRDQIDALVAGRTVYADYDLDGALDPDEPSTLSTANGYTLTGVRAGTWTVRQVLPEGWLQTRPAAGAGISVTLTPAGSTTGRDFGTTYNWAQIYADVFDDDNANGVKDPAEVGRANVTVYLDANDNGQFDSGEASVKTSTGLQDSVLGRATFTRVAAGTYTVRAVLPGADWQQILSASGGGNSVTVAPGGADRSTKFAFFYDWSSIGGIVYDDADADGVLDSTEARLQGRTIYLDLDNDGVYDSPVGANPDISTTTDVDGHYFFERLPKGTYYVRQILPTGWRQTHPAPGTAHTFNFSLGQGGIGNFGSTDEPLLGVIDGVIFYDSNADGAIANESRAQGRTAFADFNGNGVFNTGEPTAVSDSIGHYQFQLAPGTYTIRLMPHTNLVQTLPVGNAGVTVTVVANQARNASNMALYDAVPINGIVFNDINGNGTRDTGEAAIAGRHVYVDRDGSRTYDVGEITAVSDAGGNYTLMAPGSAVHFVRQELPAGWAQTAPLNPEVTVGSIPLTHNFGSRVNPQQPFNAAPFLVGDTPVIIEAEQYDQGGESVAYHDTDAGNGGAPIRTSEGVDLKLISGSNYRVNNAFAGEWFEYTIDLAKGDDYTLEYRVSSRGSNGRFRVETFDPIMGTWTNDVGAFTIPNTGSHTTWTTLKQTRFLPGGRHVFRFTIEQNSTYGSAGNFDWFRITNANAQQPPPPEEPPPSGTVTIDNAIAAYVRNGAYASQNFGEDAQLIVKTSANSGNTREGYLKFDVSSLPDDPGAITDVKLRIYGRKSASGTSPTVAVFGASNTGWAEGSITWNSKPATGGGALASRSISNLSDAWQEFDVTDYVKAARQNGQSTITLVLRATNTTDPQAWFNSDDAASNRPQLVAETTGSTGNPPAQALLVTPGAISVPETSKTGFGVKLASQPVSDVTVTIAKQGGGDGDLGADRATLTFTPANWNVAQSVFVSAAADADTTNGQATFAVTSSGLTSVNVIATEADDDTPTPPAGGTILADAATYVRGGTSAGLNFGTAGELVVKQASGPNTTREAYLKFDLSGVTTIDSATLRLNARLSSTTNASLVSEVFSASDTSWTETGLTWDAKPAAGGGTVHGSVSVSGTTAQWYAIDLTDLLKAELAAGRTMVTLVLKNTTASDAQTVIASDETVDGPQLVVE